MRFAPFLMAISLLQAQGTSPKTKATDYPVHMQMDTVTLAAEYLVHSLPTAKDTLVASDYLVVEVGFFGPPMSRLKMSPDQFNLRVNGKGTPLGTQLPGMVASSIKFPSSRPHTEATATVGAGDGSVIVGPRPPAGRFPGDPNDRPPAGQPSLAKEREVEDTIDYKVRNASLPEGEKSLPRSGLIYFAWQGKTKNIHSLELFYEGPMGKATLKVLP